MLKPKSKIRCVLRTHWGWRWVRIFKLGMEPKEFSVIYTEICQVMFCTVFWRVATSRPGRPGLTTFCETLGEHFSSSNFSHFGKWSYRTDEMVPGLQVFLFSPPFFYLFSLISENEATGQIKWSQGLPNLRGTVELGCWAWTHQSLAYYRLITLIPILCKVYKLCS